MSVPVRYSSFLNFYPRPPRGGRLLEFGQILRRLGISIHALREEGDFDDVDAHCDEGISIHALREEGDSAVGCPGCS
mgnify:CR=1 FL=1